MTTGVHHRPGAAVSAPSPAVPAPPVDLAFASTGLERFAALGLLLFLAALYSNVAILLPALAPFQPAKLIAVVALLALVAGRLARGAPAVRLDATQTRLVLALVFLAAASTFGALWPGLAAGWAVDFLKMAAVYLLIVHVVDRPTRLRLVAATLMCCSLMPAAAAIWRAVQGIGLVEGTRAAWVGLFEDPNELAYSLVIVLPLTVALYDVARSHRGRAACATAGVIQVAAVVATQSRGGLLGLLVVLAMIMWRYRVRTGLVVAVGLMAAVGLAFASDSLWRRLELVTTYDQDASITGRLQAWRVGWMIFLDRWWLGVGIGNFPLAWPLYAESPGGKWITAHNAFIQVLGELGAAGFAAFVALLATTAVGLKRARRAARDAADRDLESFASALGIALWGYIACGMVLSVAFSWFFYLLLGLSVSVIVMASPMKRALSANGHGRTRPWG